MVEVGDMVRFIAADVAREPRWVRGDIAVVDYAKRLNDELLKRMRVKVLRTGHTLLMDEQAFTYRILEKLDDQD